MIGSRLVVLLGGVVFGATAAVGCGRAEAQLASSIAEVQQVAYLKAANPDIGDHFAGGGSLPGHIGNALTVSADGNTIAVGAPHESSAARGINGDQDDNSLYNSGAVYVYVRSGDSWTQQAYIKASNPGQSDLFGMTVALSADGNLMAVAAPWERSAATGINGDQNDDSLPQAGAVYVFTRAGDAWSQQAYVKGSNTGRAASEGEPIGDGDQFGLSLALSGDGNTMAVGAPTEDSAAMGINGDQTDDSATSAGAAYLFSRTGNTWTQQAYIKGANTGAADLFGYGVGLNDDGNTLVVAGYDEDGGGRGVNPDLADGGRNGSGAIYVFSRTGTAWRQDAYLKGSRSEGNDALGYSLAISGDGSTIVAGAGDESCLVGGINPAGCDMDKPENASGGSAGAAYVWVRSGDTWAEQAFVKASNPDLQDWFAARLAVSGDGNTLLVGAPMEDSNARGVNGGQQDNSATESGAAYLFTRSGTTWSQQAYMKADNADEFDELGASVAVSGDGRTLLVGARTEGGGAVGVNGDQGDNSAPTAGAVYVWAVSP